MHKYFLLLMKVMKKKVINFSSTRREKGGYGSNCQGSRKEEEKEEVDEQEAIEDVDTDDVTQSNEVLQDQQEVLKIEKVKPKKPIKYNKKVLLYVATTSNNDFLINKQLDKKLVSLSLSLSLLFTFLFLIFVIKPSIQVSACVLICS